MRERINMFLLRQEPYIRHAKRPIYTPSAEVKRIPIVQLAPGGGTLLVLASAECRQAEALFCAADRIPWRTPSLPCGARSRSASHLCGVGSCCTDSGQLRVSGRTKQGKLLATMSSKI